MFHLFPFILGWTPRGRRLESRRRKDLFRLEEPTSSAGTSPQISSSRRRQLHHLQVVLLLQPNESTPTRRVWTEIDPVSILPWRHEKPVCSSPFLSRHFETLSRRLSISCLVDRTVAPVSLEKSWHWRRRNTSRTHRKTVDSFSLAERQLGLRRFKV